MILYQRQETIISNDEARTIEIDRRVKERECNRFKEVETWRHRLIAKL